VAELVRFAGRSAGWILHELLRPLDFVTATIDALSALGYAGSVRRTRRAVARAIDKDTLF
jgi:hypothetical protein